MTQLFQKLGRRYVPWGHAQQLESDAMKAGECRITFCAGNGERRFTYGVKPDTAGFVAAAEVARVAMEQAMQAAAISKPSGGTTLYTKRQRKIIDQFRADMAAAGGLIPTWWEVSCARDIAQAGIDAVRDWKP